MSPRAQVYLLGLFLISLGLGLVAYKSQVLSLPIIPGAYKTIWTIEAKVEFDALGGEVKTSLALPKTQPNMEVLDEIFSSSGYGFNIEKNQGHERAVWSKRQVSGKQALYYKLDVHQQNDYMDDGQVNLSTAITLPDWAGTRRASLRAATEALIETSWQASADRNTFASQLLKSLNDPKNNDARLIHNDLIDKTQVQIALDLLAMADIPAHILRGIYLESDRSNIGASSLLEIHDGKRWQVFDPVSGTSGLPENFLIWQRADKSLLDVEGANNSRVRFSTLANDIPTRDVALQQMGGERAALLDYSIYSLPIEQQSVFKFILLIPVGTLFVIFMRVVIGMRTAGTFMPVLLAIAFIQTTLLSGVLIFLLILTIGLWVRTYLSRLDLLLVSRIAAVVVIVVGLMALISIVSYKLGIEQALTVTFFPMIIIAWTIEHMSILWEDDGPMEAVIQTAGSLFVAIICYGAMTNHYLKHWMFNFPELLLVLLGLIIILGHYTGYRVSELIRFRNMVSK
ncbi:inactive transglutaminase family protein [Oceanicoccus sp. KOV_DT_Chl]|uniref:inactive transglutaminase family protein n=1 Tax=Oceanicoccus sp. KOV_DT_Chl TaxID=1904639 RepID=UPI000C7CCA37|nr:inactive transglutaminase family protein [Oceanicoccus sp. KOV_DT_Chl]